MEFVQYKCIIIIIIIIITYLEATLRGKRLLKKATLRGIGDVGGKGPVRLNELHVSLIFRRKLLIFIAQISSLV